MLTLSISISLSISLSLTHTRRIVEESKALNLVIKYILRKPTTILSAQLRLDRKSVV